MGAVAAGGLKKLCRAACAWGAAGAGILGANAALSVACAVLTGAGVAGVADSVKDGVRRTICPVCSGLCAKVFNCAAFPATGSGVFAMF